MKTMLFNILPAICLWLGICCMATAQEAPVAQSDQITQDGVIIQGDGSDTGSFETVTVDAGTESSVTLQFPVSMAGKPVAVEALDGGTVTSDGGTPTVAVDGSLAFSFSVTTQPGVHRVIVVDPNADADSPHIIALVRFEVPPPGQ
ncbi:MAG TPA: hypothetical protein VFA61_03985 [Candidatus Udaeobacter sp.]|nr:hypothetical protein [Candidatus Udaeobacter sp.]